MDALYREAILDHYKHPHNFGELEDFSSSRTTTRSAATSSGSS
jgi:NifU-like protein involved in Fe-S cluster formation